MSTFDQPSDDSWRDPIYESDKRRCQDCGDMAYDDSESYMLHFFCPSCLNARRVANEAHRIEIEAAGPVKVRVGDRRQGTPERRQRDRRSA